MPKKAVVIGALYSKVAVARFIDQDEWPITTAIAVLICA